MRPLPCILLATGLALGQAPPAAAAPSGIDTPREFYPHMVDLPGFAADPPKGSRVVMSGQLSLTVSRRYHATKGDTTLEARLQASSAMAEEWRKLEAAQEGNNGEAVARRVRVGGFPAIVHRSGEASATGVTVKLGAPPFTLFSLKAHGLGPQRTLELTRRFPLKAMRSEVASR